jgi:hypothetical protein
MDDASVPGKACSDDIKIVEVGLAEENNAAWPLDDRTPFVLPAGGMRGPIVSSPDAHEIAAADAVKWTAFRDELPERYFLGPPESVTSSINEVLWLAEAKFRDQVTTGKLPSYGRPELDTPTIEIPCDAWNGSRVIDYRGAPADELISVLAHRVGKDIYLDFYDVRFRKVDIEFIWEKPLAGDYIGFDRIGNESQWRKLSKKTQSKIRKAITSWYAGLDERRREEMTSLPNEKEDFLAIQKAFGEGIPRQLMRDVRKPYYGKKARNGARQSRG